MIKNKSVIVVGAGASFEAGLPVGAGLKNDISSILKTTKKSDFGDISINNRSINYALPLLRSQGYDIDSLYQACRHISEAMPQAMSIDNFIDTHRGNEYIEICGKLAIASSILRAENESKLYVDLDNINNIPDYRQLESTWFNAFWQLITENCQADELEDRFSTISFIIFNYDRCIEHFLYYSLKNVYRLNNTDAANIVNNINIYHPYGVVGNLPWQNGQDSIAFGGAPDHHLLIQLANNIKTFTEGTDPESSEICKIKDCMLHAETVLFLGFAFHRLNMQLITPDHTGAKGARKTSYYATAVGISNTDIEVIKEDIKTISKSGNVSIEVRNDRKCCDIFHEYKRSLYLY